MATALIEHVLAHQLAQNDAVPAAGQVPSVSVPVNDWTVESLFEFCVCDDALLLNQAGT
jgi:hypothetical protein